MEPYTAQGIEAREKDEAPLPSQMYELVGIVVHSGQASAGHYYSFIKDKRCGYLWLHVVASSALLSLFVSLSLSLFLFLSLTHSLSLLYNQLYPSTIPEEVEGEEAPPPLSSDSPTGRWLRFNDTKVEEFMMSDSALEAECFGGSYKAKPSDSEY